MKYWQIDAFTDRPFGGNPAAVVILDGFPDDAWLRAFAAEMNLSETAFVVPRSETDRFDLRWFTPTVEVDLCGHATLAAAHALRASGHWNESGPLNFHTRGGVLAATADGPDITLDFPSLTLRECDEIEELTAAMGKPPVEIYRTPYDVLAVYDDPETVRDADPDLTALAGIECRGVIITAPGPSDAPEFDFVSRFFAPAAGVPEDPVTGSAHCALTPYWSRRLGRTELNGRQLSRRGGQIRCRLAGDRVRLTGRCVTTLRGTVEAAARPGRR